MNANMAHMFLAIEHDPKTGLFHIAAILLDAHRQFLGQLYTTRRTQSNETNHAMAFDALEAGCVFARQLHMHKILAHVPDEVHQAMSDLRNSNSDLPVDDDAGVDYLRTGVYIYRTGLESDGAVPAPWAQTFMKKAHDLIAKSKSLNTRT